MRLVLSSGMTAFCSDDEDGKDAPPCSVHIWRRTCFQASSMGIRADERTCVTRSQTRSRLSMQVVRILRPVTGLKYAALTTFACGSTASRLGWSPPRFPAPFAGWHSGLSNSQVPHVNGLLAERYRRPAMLDLAYRATLKRRTIKVT